MKVIEIDGGHKLTGSIRVSGAKNATVALIPAAILTDFQAQEMCQAEWMSVPKQRLMSVVKPPSTQSILLTRQSTMPYFRE